MNHMLTDLIQANLYAALDDDWVSEANLYSIVKQVTGDLQPDLVQAICLAIAADLALQGEVEFGELGDNGFQRWEGPASLAVASAFEKWPLRVDSLPGDAFWLNRLGR